MTGRIHSFQSLGTADGPGVRAVVFMQGCPLRCACCHNPDTWDFNGGTKVTAEEIFVKIKRLKNYFGKDGGVTASGGEPLMQPEFLKELFTLCKTDGITTAIDTSGCILNDSVKELLKLTDTVLLDYKYITDMPYVAGCMQLRNKAMVDASDYGIAYCTRNFGGTASTIKYAKEKNKDITVIFDI